MADDNRYYCIIRENPDGRRVDVTLDYTGFSGFNRAEDAVLCLAFHLAGLPHIDGFLHYDVSDLRERAELFMRVLVCGGEFAYLGGKYFVVRHAMCYLSKTLDGSRTVYTRDGPYIKDKIEPIPIR